MRQLAGHLAKRRANAIAAAIAHLAKRRANAIAAAIAVAPFRRSCLLRCAPLNLCLSLSLSLSLLLLSRTRFQMVHACACVGGHRSSAHRRRNIEILRGHLAVWSSGMILAQGARGPGFNSQNSPLRVLFVNFGDAARERPTRKLCTVPAVATKILGRHQAAAAYAARHYYRKCPPRVESISVRQREFSTSGVAQWLACWAHNPKVRGSKPRSAMPR